MARLSKLIRALLSVEREDPDKRPVVILVGPDRLDMGYKIQKVHDEKDRVVLVVEVDDDSG